MAEPNHCHPPKRPRLVETKSSKDPNEPVVMFVALFLFLTETNDINRDNKNATTASQCSVFNLAQIRPWMNATSHFNQFSNELVGTINPVNERIRTANDHCKTDRTTSLNLTKYVFNKQFGKGPTEALLLTDSIESVLQSNGGIISVQKQKQNTSYEAFVTVRRFNIGVHHVHIFFDESGPNPELRVEVNKRTSELLKTFNKKYHTINEQHLRLRDTNCNIHNWQYNPTVYSYQLASSDDTKPERHIKIVKIFTNNHCEVIDAPALNDELRKHLASGYPCTTNDTKSSEHIT